MSQSLTRQDQIKPFLVGAQKQITSLLQDEAKAKKFLDDQKLKIESMGAAA